MMFERLLRNAAEAPLSDKTRLSQETAFALAGVGSFPRKGVKTIGAATKHMQKIAQDEAFVTSNAAHLLAYNSQDLQGRDQEQLAMVMSASLTPEAQEIFLKRAAAAGATGLVSKMIERNDLGATRPEVLNDMADRASQNGQAETFAALLEKGAEHENTSTYVMIKSKDMPSARTALANGADAGARNENDNTLLHAAGRVHSANLAESIVEKAGPEIVHSRNKDGKSFLSMALDPSVGNEVDVFWRQRTRNHDVERMIEMAAENGFDFTQTDNDGNTLLHDFASCRRDFTVEDQGSGPRYKIERMLSEQGLDKMARNKAGQTAGDIALAQNEPEMSAILAGHGCLPGTEEGISKVVQNSVQTGQGDALMQMRAHGVDWVEHLGGAEVAPFEVVQQAAKQGSVAPVAAARAGGLSFDVRNEKSETPFSVARSLSCNEETMHTMLEIKSQIVQADIQNKISDRVEARKARESTRQASTEVR
jgi:ankyrin repeat protein